MAKRPVPALHLVEILSPLVEGRCRLGVQDASEDLPYILVREAGNVAEATNTGPLMLGRLFQVHVRTASYMENVELRKKVEDKMRSGRRLETIISTVDNTVGEDSGDVSLVHSHAISCIMRE